MVDQRHEDPEVERNYRGSKIMQKSTAITFFPAAILWVGACWRTEQQLIRETLVALHCLRLRVTPQLPFRSLAFLLQLTHVLYGSARDLGVLEGQIWSVVGPDRTSVMHVYRN